MPQSSSSVRFHALQYILYVLLLLLVFCLLLEALNINCQTLLLLLQL